MVALAVPLLGSLSACAAELPSTAFAPAPAPTMAPEQSVGEACALSGAEVDRIVAQAEHDIATGLEDAAAALVQGQTPSFAFLALSVDESLDSVRRGITNGEVAAALGRLSDGFSGFGAIAQPESVLGVPGFLGDVKAQLLTLTEASDALQKLCTKP